MTEQLRHQHDETPDAEAVEWLQRTTELLEHASALGAVTDEELSRAINVCDIELSQHGERAVAGFAREKMEHARELFAFEYNRRAERRKP
jgi:hypothetical protein